MFGELPSKLDLTARTLNFSNTREQYFLKSLLIGLPHSPTSLEESNDFLDRNYLFVSIRIILWIVLLMRLKIAQTLSFFSHFSRLPKSIVLTFVSLHGRCRCDLVVKVCCAKRWYHIMSLISFNYTWHQIWLLFLIWRINHLLIMMLSRSCNYSRNVTVTLYMANYFRFYTGFLKYVR